MKKLLWGVFVVYQLIGCYLAVQYWPEIVEQFETVRWTVEGILS